MIDTTAALRLGLRVDVDTHEGLKFGVPRLLEILAQHEMHGSFFFSMGPDRAGAALFNLLRPGFFAKMRRTRAARVYGLRTILSGTLLPARPIGTAFPELIRRSLAQGQEAGVHAWDHRLWQDHLLDLSPARIASELDRARAAFRAATGAWPLCFAAPAWLANATSLLHQERFELDYASDCRGHEPFLPQVGTQRLRTPQVPTTLPTLDEALGATHADAAAFFATIGERAMRQRWPVLTIHAELEGGPHAAAFATFLSALRSRGARCITLSTLLAERCAAGPLPVAELRLAPIAGRHGQLATQWAG